MADSDESDQEMESQSESTSPLRRSSRIRAARLSTQNSNSSMDSDSEDQQSEQENNDHSNHNRNRNGSNNRNRNRDRNKSNDNDEDSDVVYDENKNEMEEESESSSGDDNDNEIDELEKETHPNLSTVLPTFVNKLGDKYTKIDEDIADVALQSLIDTAQSLAEYNNERDDYQQHTQRLQQTMNKLLKLSRDLKIEQLMYSRVATEIREEKLNENQAGHDEEDYNPLQTGEWDTYLDSYRNKVSIEIESENVADDTARIKQFVKEKTLEYKQQFEEAIQIDPIEEYESDDSQGMGFGGDRNHNQHRNNNENESDDDLDIMIDKSSKDVNIGSLKCPLTTLIFQKPVKSKQCGHCFERVAVLGYIENKMKTGELAQCPLPGCSNILTKDQLIRDVKIEKLIKAQSKKEQDQDSEEDDDNALDFSSQPT